MMGERKVIRRHTELEVYKKAFAVAMRIFEETKRFPTEERYAMVDQMRCSSRSVCANLAEAWRKRRYEAASLSKLSDCEAEAAETHTWVHCAVECGDLPRETAATFYGEYDAILGMLIHMITHPQDWTV